MTDGRGGALDYCSCSWSDEPCRRAHLQQRFHAAPDIWCQIQFIAARGLNKGGEKRGHWSRVTQSFQFRKIVKVGRGWNHDRTVEDGVILSVQFLFSSVFLGTGNSVQKHASWTEARVKDKNVQSHCFEQTLLKLYISSDQQSYLLTVRI